MRCPKCSHMDDRVIDSRTVRNGDVIRRRRNCLDCGHRFTTYEEVVKSNMRVIKRDGRHEEIDRRKMMAGINRACEKRPISMSQMENVIDSVINEIEAEYEREVPATVLGKKVMDKLQNLDEVAYVRFASVYRRFKDVSQFLSEVEGLIERG